MPEYLSEAHGIIVTYDVTDQDSFDVIDTFLEHMQGHVESDIPKLLIGTKNDMEGRVVSFMTAQEKANKSFQRMYVETSAKENCQVDGAFRLLTSNIITGLQQLGKSFKAPE